MSLTQTEYEYLIKQDKEFENLIDPIQLGPAPIKWTRQINSLSTNDIFLLDFYRGSFELTRYTFNKRYHQTVILIRYDNAGRHTNPDGQLFDGAHVHLYKEGYDDKFAYPISEIGINESDSIETKLKKILQFCNVKKIPSIEVPMF
jgi:hypothetical protein